MAAVNTIAPSASPIGLSTIWVAHTPPADAEERAKVGLPRRIHDDACAELGVGAPLAKSELKLVCHATASGDPKVEHARRIGPICENYFLRVNKAAQAMPGRSSLLVAIIGVLPLWLATGTRLR